MSGPPLTREQLEDLSKFCATHQTDPRCTQHWHSITEPGRRPSTEEIAYEIIAELKLPPGTIKIGPDPTHNEWNMAIVGYPLWLWLEGPTTLTTTKTAHGATVTITAKRNSVTFYTGDGNTITCTHMPHYRPPHNPNKPTTSPSCGHTYTKASLPKGKYTITAQSNWTFTWTTPTQQGTTPGQTTTTRQLPVGELQSVVRR